MKERINSDKDLYWLWICNIRNVWNGTIEKLLEVFQTPEEAFKAGEAAIRDSLKGVKGANEEMIAAIMNSRSEDNVKRIREILYKKKIRFMHCESEEYPDRLRNIYKPPYGLYVKSNSISNLNLLPDIDVSVAIVGARNCTAYGRRMAYELGFELANRGAAVISGMARGIDGESHRGAVYAGGKTIAVLGCGVDICYPRDHIELYENISDNGAVISEYPVGTQPIAWQFPMRNRIISGLSDKIIVVEARKKSGSLITVEYGLEQGKDIYAVPGRIGDALSEGCNRLIYEGAGIVTSPKNAAEDLGVGAYHNCKNSENKNIVLEKDLELLYSCVDYFPKSIGRLMAETGMDMADIYRNIITLQMMGLIEEPSKSNYVKK